MRFEWDEKKNRSNIRKHGVAFEVAAAALHDLNALVVFDRFVESEDRWRALCMHRGDIFLIAYTIREEDGDEIYRIISARKATPSEFGRYQDHQENA